MATKDTDADIIVVGGGPAGVAVAVNVARAGLRVVLCEARTFERPLLADLRTGEVVSPGAQRELVRLGFDNAGAAWRLDDFDILRQFWTAQCTTRHRLPRGLRYWQSDRGLFDRALLDFARANGVTVRTGFRIGGVVQDTKDGRVGGVVGREGAEMRARLVVDASGRNSAIVARLGLKAAETEFRRFAVVCFFSDVPQTRAGEWEQHFLGGNTTLNGSRMRTGLFRFTLETDLAVRQRYPDLHRPHDIFQTLLQEKNPTLAERMAAATSLDYAIAYAPVGYRVPQRVQPGLLLVGDAAGYLDPATGQGIEFALRMARLAAQSIISTYQGVKVLREHLSHQLPNRFEAYEVGLQRELRQMQRDLRIYLRLTRQPMALKIGSKLWPVREIALRRLVVPRAEG